MTLAIMISLRKSAMRPSRLLALVSLLVMLSCRSSPQAEAGAMVGSFDSDGTRMPWSDRRAGHWKRNSGHSYSTRSCMRERMTDAL